MPSEDESLFDEALDTNRDVWTQISKNSADAERGLWNVVQLPFNAIEKGVKLGFDPAAREAEWTSVTQSSEHLARMADSAGQYELEAVQDPTMLYRDARDRLQGFATDQVYAENQEGRKYWTDAAGNVVFGGVTLLAGGAALKADQAVATAVDEATASQASNVVSAVGKCPNAARDWSNVPGTSWEGQIHRMNVTDYVDKGWNPRDAPYRYTGADENGLQAAYASTDLETPLSEVMPDKLDDAIVGNHYESLTPISKSVKLENYLDLTDPSVRQTLNLSENDLLSENHAFTQQLGAEAYMSGFNGIIAPSARNIGGKNIVSFGGF